VHTMAQTGTTDDVIARRHGPIAWDLAHMSQQTCSIESVQGMREPMCACTMSMKGCID